MPVFNEENSIKILAQEIQKVLPEPYVTSRIYFNRYKPGIDGCLHRDGVDLTALI